MTLGYWPDDRGKHVRVLTLTALQGGRSEAGRLSTAEVHRLSAELDARGNPPTMHRRLAVLLLVALAAMLAFVSTIPGISGRWLSSGLVGGVLVAVVIVGRMLARRRGHTISARARAIAATGLCASCGYRIGDLPVEADGCRVCPECGAAWRPSELDVSHVTAAGAG